MSLESPGLCALNYRGDHIGILECGQVGLRALGKGSGLIDASWKHDEFRVNPGVLLGFLKERTVASIHLSSLKAGWGQAASQCTFSC